MSEEFDQDTLETIKSMMKDKLPDVGNRFLENAQNYLNNIEDGLREKDLKKISDNAHPMKSSSAMLGFVGLSKLAEDMEHTAKNFGDDNSDSNIEVIRALYGEACTFFARASDKLRQEIEGIS